MARLTFGMQQSLDGYIDGPAGNIELGPPDAIVFQHFVDHVSSLSGMLYGRRIYEVMRYWDDDQLGWSASERAFAEAWRSKPKWVASRSSVSVGANATLIQGDVVDFAARLKAERDGEIDVAGAELAGVLSAASLVDEYRLYFRSQVLGSGKPYFTGKIPPLHLQSVGKIGEQVAQLIYVPA